MINLARGDAEAFLAVYGSYAGAREVTAWRLYLESVDDVLRRSAKVIIDTSGKGMSGIVPYLPINDIRPPAAPQGQIAPTAPGVAPAAPLGGPTPPVLLNGGPTR